MTHAARLYRHVCLHIALAGLCAIALVILPGCAGMGIGGINLISVEEEWQMGERFEQELARELQLSEDEEVQRYITRLGEQLVAQTDMAELDWRFYVVEGEQVNAFNVPGGLVYVYSGLITQIANASELVAVMGHEVGHGVARHGTERLTQQHGFAMLASAVLGAEPGLIEQLVAQVVTAGAMAQYSQAQEFEADDLGVDIMAAAGYHPAGMVDLLETLMALADTEPGAVQEFFATHPAVPERIERVEARIEAMELGDLRRDEAEFRTVQQRLGGNTPR